MAQLGRDAAVCVLVLVWSVHGGFAANEVLMACSNAIACPGRNLPELSNMSRGLTSASTEGHECRLSSIGLVVCEQIGLLSEACPKRRRMYSTERNTVEYRLSKACSENLKGLKDILTESQHPSLPFGIMGIA